MFLAGKILLCLFLEYEPLTLALPTRTNAKTSVPQFMPVLDQVIDLMINVCNAAKKSGYQSKKELTNEAAELSPTCRESTRAVLSLGTAQSQVLHAESCVCPNCAGSQPKETDVVFFLVKI